MRVHKYQTQTYTLCFHWRKKNENIWNSNEIFVPRLCYPSSRFPFGLYFLQKSRQLRRKLSIQGWCVHHHLSFESSLLQNRVQSQGFAYIFDLDFQQIAKCFSGGKSCTEREGSDAHCLIKSLKGYEGWWCLLLVRSLFVILLKIIELYSLYSVFREAFKKKKKL